MSSQVRAKAVDKAKLEAAAKTLHEAIVAAPCFENAPGPESATVDDIWSGRAPPQ